MTLSDESLIELINQARNWIFEARRASESERNTAEFDDDATLPLPTGEDWIDPFLGTFRRIMHSLARDTVKHRKFTGGGFEDLDPQSYYEWLRAWPILENPVIGDWVSRYGAKHPKYRAYILSVDVQHRLLLIASERWR